MSSQLTREMIEIEIDSYIYSKLLIIYSKRELDAGGYF